MIIRAQQRHNTQWVLVFLAALVAVLATILSSASASGATTAVAGARVGASAVVVDVAVEPPEHIVAGQRLGNSVAGPEFVVDIGVAAESGGALARAPRTLDELSQQGAQMDRNGLTQAGRALQKHAYRPGNTVYPKVPGAELNSAGQDVLDDILTNPLTAERSYVHPNYGPGARVPAAGHGRPV